MMKREEKGKGVVKSMKNEKRSEKKVKKGWNKGREREKPIGKLETMETVEKRRKEGNKEKQGE